MLFSLPEIDTTDQPPTFYNTVGISGPDGYVGRYRKRLLYHIDEAYASAGPGPRVFVTPYGTFGISICLDAAFDGNNYAAYKAMGADAVLVVMDWDQDPNGAERAVSYFVDRAWNNELEIFAADTSAWDGTGHYGARMSSRERQGLPEPAVGVDGVSYHILTFGKVQRVFAECTGGSC